MYFVTGSNTFSQWLIYSKSILENFCKFSVENFNQCDFNFDINASTLIHIGWSHNIFNLNDKFIITGDFKCSGKSVEFINMPTEYMKSTDVIVVSNDYYLVVCHRNSCTLYFVNLENDNVKQINLANEIPLDANSGSQAKKLKFEDHIYKCDISNEMLIFLTKNGLVYNGFIPNLVDTSHCIGKPIDVRCGNEHYMLLTNSGRVYTWGNGRRLQLGHGDVNILDEPTEVEALSGIKIVKISTGGWHSLALSEFGDVYAWGWNESGQLGIKDKTLKSFSVPTLVDIFDDSENVVNNIVIDVACGSKHSAILLDDNTVWTCGSNKYGQLGLSIAEYPVMLHFKKCFSPTLSCQLICGEWSTVIRSNPLTSHCRARGSPDSGV